MTRGPRVVHGQQNRSAPEHSVEWMCAIKDCHVSCVKQSIKPQDQDFRVTGAIDGSAEPTSVISENARCATASSVPNTTARFVGKSKPSRVRTGPILYR